MNKKKLQEFATWAKLNLEKQIEISLKKIGINSETDIKRSRVQGDITVIDGIETTFKKGFQSLREDIVNRIKSDGFSHTIEQFASTWFNRIVALRFMEVHNYLDHGFKLFPTESNTLPEILSKLSLVSDELKLDMVYCNQLLSSGNHNEELYRYVLFQQCNELAKPLPMLFSVGMSYLEYFIPAPLLFGETIINKLIEIDKNDFKEDVEILGWLYQFYIANKKAEVFAAKNIVTKDTLPAVTQLFTPDWIVKYMAENSIGRIWLESYPNSPIKTDMKYYVEEVEQEPEVEEKLKAIKYKDVNPEDIKIIEPCSGSGHILVYCFDLLVKMYVEKGYTKRDIPQHVFKNNLVGLDIDQRATQIASFALVMRARSIDNKFFDENRYVRPKVFEIIDSKAILNANYNGKKYLEIIKEYNSKQWIGENQLSDDEIKSIEYVVDLFDDAKVIGSLLKVKPAKYLSIRKKLSINEKENTQPDIFTSTFFSREFKEVLEILRASFFLASKYDVMITNPPYIGSTGLELKPKKYFSDYYPSSKSDMFAMFMETGFVSKNGFTAIINMQAWIYQPTYRNLRTSILSNYKMESFIHLGSRAFEEISGEVVQTVTTVIRNCKMPLARIKFVRLTEQVNKELIFLEANNQSSNNIFIKTATLLSKIPDSVFGYWISDIAIDLFSKSKFSDHVQQRVRISTGDNDRFVRYWHEVDFNKVLTTKWFIFNKGGLFRRWYGNLNLVINYENNGIELKDSPKYQKSNENYYFKSGITYTDVSTGNISFRLLPEGSISDSSGPMLEVYNEKYIYYYLGIANSKVFQLYAQFLCPGLHYNWGSLALIPTIVDNNLLERVNYFVKENIELSRQDWNSYETSMGFICHSLYIPGRLRDNYEKYYNLCNERFETLKRNEIELNKMFINTYGFNDILDFDISNNDITITLPQKNLEVKSLISYLVGILMNRFPESSNENNGFSHKRSKGAVYYDINSNGIYTLFDDVSNEKGLTQEIIRLIKRFFGVDCYRNNIEFVAESIGKKSNETNEETLNRYLNDEFYFDHLKNYQKRPIYWMFSSGKQNGFKCLVYMHKYKDDTLAKINANYFQPATTILRTKINELDQIIGSALDKDKIQLERKRFIIIEQLTEAIEYGQVLDYMANKYISINLDDGVKVNYAKFQGIEISTSNGKVKKDLLVPIK
ncbi:MAG: BREX-1 system adenine-specific DNA-methyltransferase PglX [Firmicutes bacterium]|nr:BREX-1 system adenine-specific DNA-methyltransferase PglX [Bacillota bacterium]